PPTRRCAAMKEPAALPLAVSEEGAAELLGVCKHTLTTRRTLGTLPTNLYARPSPKRIVYSVELLRAWVRCGCPDVWPPGFDPTRSGPPGPAGAALRRAGRGLSLLSYPGCRHGGGSPSSHPSPPRRPEGH